MSQIEERIIQSMDGTEPGSLQQAYALRLLATLYAYKHQGYRDVDRDLVNATSINLDPVTRSLIELTRNPYSPETVTAAFRRIWESREIKLREAGITDISVSVADCPYNEEDLRKLEEKGRRVGYIPQPLSTQPGLIALAKIWPEIGDPYAFEKVHPEVKQTDRSGWFDYESGTDAPNVNTVESELNVSFLSDERAGMALNEYIIASQDSMLMTGRHLDERTSSRLLGSCYKGGVVRASFTPDGDLKVDRQDSYRRSPLVGGRSVRFK